jgi:hypothetical protein
MIDTVQAVLLFVIVLLTVLFVVLGVQIFYILKDLRETIRRTNNILEDVENVSEGASSAIESLTSMVGGASTFRTIASILSIFKKKKE